MEAIVPTEKIRNVLLVGHAGTGKSTLAESMLHVAGNRDRHAHGSPTLDFEPEEQDRGRSLGLGVAAVTFDGYKINVLDAPGSAEAIGDAYPAIAAADVAVFVVDATVGLQPQHEELWRACAKRDLPRLVFLNKLDLEHAEYQTNIDALREAYGKPLAPVHMPIGLAAELTGVIDLLHFNAVEFDGDKRIEEEVPEVRREQAERNREFLVEAVVENDDALLERYLEGETPSAAELAEVFAHGVASCGFFPVLVGSAEEGIGVELLLQFLIEECPSPADAPPLVAGGLEGDTAVYVAKTFSDQYVGRINVLRILRGTLQADDNLANARTSTTQRLHNLFTLLGKEQVPVQGGAAGDIVAVAKLDDVATGDVLYASEPVEIDDFSPPEGYHRVVLRPVSASDDDKLSTALQRIMQEDPSITSARDADSGALVLGFYGPQHVDVTTSRLERKYGVHVVAESAPVAFRETIRGAASGIGKHVKQTGGHGQYGVAQIEVAPTARGEGFAFVDKIVGGAIPNQWIPSVEKGIREAMKAGQLGGFPVVDVEVRLVDGKFHSVDSSDAAFQMAGILAFRDALAATDVVLLEPVMEVDVAVPDDLTGAIMSDLSGRRGRIMGTDAVGGGLSMIHAHVPEVELSTFAAEFRALTSGRGSVALRYHHHEEVPDQIAKRLLEQHSRKKADA